MFFGQKQNLQSAKKKNQNYEHDYSIFLLEIQDLAFSKSMIDILSYFEEKSDFFYHKIKCTMRKLNNWIIVFCKNYQISKKTMNLCIYLILCKQKLKI